MDAMPSSPAPVPVDPAPAPGGAAPPVSAVPQPSGPGTAPGESPPGPAGPWAGWAPPGGPTGRPALPPPHPPHASLARRLAAPLGMLAGIAAAFAYVGTVDPNEPGHYPACPLLRYTGIYCPGCGGLRSAHAFIHGDLGTAFGANAAATAGYLVFALVWVAWLIRSVQNRPLRINVAAGWWWALGGVLVIFSVVRNLPFGSALVP
ncbi:DUF2752 domain-containing protein [Streptomyces sp. NPDC002835]